MAIYKIFDNWTYEVFDLDAPSIEIAPFDALIDRLRSKSEANKIPAWSSFDALDFREFLGELAVLDTEHSIENGSFRLWGTKLVDIFDFDMTGKTLIGNELNPQDIDIELNYKAAQDHKITRSTGPMNWHNRGWVELSYISFPMSEDGSNVDRIIKSYRILGTSEHAPNLS